ncbi:MAG: hypothetical protein H6922_04365 [Pseudomonadaceae bacterium]|nr:hypothetical protein [Pseudomonadaceae bacterium]
MPMKDVLESLKGSVQKGVASAKARMMDSGRPPELEAVLANLGNDGTQQPTQSLLQAITDGRRKSIQLSARECRQLKIDTRGMKAGKSMFYSVPVQTVYEALVRTLPAMPTHQIGDSDEMPRFLRGTTAPDLTGKTVSEGPPPLPTKEPRGTPGKTKEGEPSMEDLLAATRKQAAERQEEAPKQAVPQEPHSAPAQDVKIVNEAKSEVIADPAWPNTILAEEKPTQTAPEVTEIIVPQAANQPEVDNEPVVNEPAPEEVQQPEPVATQTPPPAPQLSLKEQLEQLDTTMTRAVEMAMERLDVILADVYAHSADTALQTVAGMSATLEDVRQNMREELGVDWMVEAALAKVAATGIDDTLAQATKKAEAMQQAETEVEGAILRRKEAEEKMLGLKRELEALQKAYVEAGEKAKHAVDTLMDSNDVAQVEKLDAVKGSLTELKTELQGKLSLKDMNLQLLIASKKELQAAQQGFADVFGRPHVSAEKELADIKLLRPTPKVTVPQYMPVKTPQVRVVTENGQPLPAARTAAKASEGTHLRDVSQVPETRTIENIREALREAREEHFELGGQTVQRVLGKAIKDCPHVKNSEVAERLKAIEAEMDEVEALLAELFDKDEEREAEQDDTRRGTGQPPALSGVAAAPESR